MLKNYFKIAWRNIIRHKTFSLINILGLSGGIAICLLLFVHVKDELSYDRFHQKAERIYRLQYNILDFNIARTPPPIASRMPDYFPEVEQSARLFNRSVSVSVPSDKEEPQRFEEDRVFFADSTVLDIFSFNIVQGNDTNPLDEPFSIMINEDIAKKYFGDRNPIGETLLLEGGRAFKITAIVQDFPSNAHFHFNMIAPYHNMFDLEQSAFGPLRDNLNNNWIASHSYTYVLLHPGQDPGGVDRAFPDFIEEYIPEQQRKGQEFILQPLLDIRLRGNIGAEVEPVGDITFVYLFIGIALMTLLIACVNFINLSTARSMQRVKEVGMRKVMGAWKGQLVVQFLGESMLICLISFVLGVIVSFYLLPEVNTLTGKSMEVADFYTLPTLLGFLALFLATGFVAGIYPAFYVTRFQPAAVLKSGKAGQAKGLSFRKVLVIFQFTVAVMLITGTVVIQDQINFFRSRPLGFQKESILTIPLFSNNFNNVFGGVTGDIRQKLNTLEEELSSNPKVISSTLSSFPPGLGAVRRNVIPEGFTAEDAIINPAVSVDYDFAQTFELEFLAGRDFDQSYGTDQTNAFLINEEAIKRYNWASPEEALGKDINLEGKEGQVIGVVKDFNFESLRGEIDALILDVNPALFGSLSVKVQTQDLPQTIHYLEESWNRFFPEKTFEYRFLDEQISEIYENEENLGKIIGYFAFLAILISCLGSYGLIMFLAQQKMKEIGIRKVLGASIGNIVYLLSRNFAILLGIAFIISIPLAYYLLDQWLADFTFRVTLSPGIFLLAGIITFGVVALTIAYQSIKAALVNPSRILRNE